MPHGTPVLDFRPFAPILARLAAVRVWIEPSTQFDNVRIQIADGDTDNQVIAIPGEILAKVICQLTEAHVALVQHRGAAL